MCARDAEVSKERLGSTSARRARHATSAKSARGAMYAGYACAISIITTSVRLDATFNVTTNSSRFSIASYRS